jgi:hypothetical protein
VEAVEDQVLLVLLLSVAAVVVEAQEALFYISNYILMT